MSTCMFNTSRRGLQYTENIKLEYKLEYKMEYNMEIQRCIQNFTFIFNFFFVPNYRKHKQSQCCYCLGSGWSFDEFPF